MCAFNLAHRNFMHVYVCVYTHTHTLATNVVQTLCNNTIDEGEKKKRAKIIVKWN